VRLLPLNRWQRLEKDVRASKCVFVCVCGRACVFVCVQVWLTQHLNGQHLPTHARPQATSVQNTRIFQLMHTHICAKHTHFPTHAHPHVCKTHAFSNSCTPTSVQNTRIFQLMHTHMCAKHTHFPTHAYPQACKTHACRHQRMLCNRQIDTHAHTFSFTSVHLAAVCDL